MIKIYQIILIVLFLSITMGEDYFPLQLGNRWQYYQYNEYLFDTTLHEFSITEEYYENDYMYYEFSRYPGSVYNYNFTVMLDRVTGEMFYSGDTCLWIDPNLAMGDTIYSYQCTDYLHYLSGIDTIEYFDIIHETHNYAIWDMLLGYRYYKLFEGIGPIRIYNYDGVSAAVISNLIAADINGTIYGEFINIHTETSIPNTFKLFSVFPNPFNPSTTISFAINVKENVILSIVDIRGRELETLINSKLEPNKYYVKWDASEFPSGIYFVQLFTKSLVKTQKLLLIK